MMKNLSLIIGAVVILLVAALVWMQVGIPETLPASSVPEISDEEKVTEDTENTMPEEESPDPSTPTVEEEPVSSGPTTFTLAEVAGHSGTQSCWTVIDDGVYDITSWIPQHPGGPQAILSLCGKDGTAAFRAQHKGASKQENILAGFKIGILK